MRDQNKRRPGTVVVVVAILVALAVLIPMGLGYLSDPPPAPTGGVNSPNIVSDDPTVPSEIQDALEEIARREADQRYCNAHPEAASTERCKNA